MSTHTFKIHVLLNFFKIGQLDALDEACTRLKSVCETRQTRNVEIPLFFLTAAYIDTGQGRVVQN